MTDNDLRGEVLDVFYKARTKVEYLELSALASHVTTQPSDVARICDQLAEAGLIKWKPLRDARGVVAGMGKITGKGVDVIEGTATPPISITIHDRSVNISGSSGVIVGNGNSQTVVGDIGKLFTAIDHSNVSEGEKHEAKTMLQKLANNPTLWAILGTFFTSGPAQ
jgi:hypothetical protein